MVLFLKETLRTLAFFILAVICLNCRSKTSTAFGQSTSRKLLPAEITESIVRILKYPGDDTTKPATPHGTGFLLYGYNTGGLTAILITNKHLFGEHKVLCVTTLFKIKGGRFEHQQLNVRLKNKKGEKIWKGHPDKNHDIAAIQININDFRFQKPVYAKDADSVGTKCYARSIVDINENFEEGAEIIFFGFPDIFEFQNKNELAMCGIDTLKPITRRGCVSTLGKQLGDCFLIEGFSYSGNSGSPVFRKAKEGETGIGVMSEGYLLIGMIRGHLPYYENPINPKTLEPIPIDSLTGPLFPSNSGLAIVEPISRILETVQQLKGVTGWELKK